MGTPYLGGWRFTSIDWVGRNVVRAKFAADGWSGRWFQAYVGRQLVGVTKRPADRELLIELPTDARQSPLALVVVEGSDTYKDHGHLLCPRPWNRYCITWEAPAVTVDLHHFDIVVSSAVGASYDAANVVGRVPFDASKTTYTFEVPGFSESGDWEVAVIPRDDASPLGNAGTATVATISAVVYPMDLALDVNGDRFTVDVDTGQLTASFDF